jgi:hypothetical protein
MKLHPPPPSNLHLKIPRKINRPNFSQLFNIIYIKVTQHDFSPIPPPLSS